jgi:putative ABC transport system permease protein
MHLTEALRLAVRAIWTSKLRSFFTLLGILVSVAFLIVVVAVIQGMNSYVSDTLTASMIGTNTFQVRRGPISIGLLDDEQVRTIAKRPLVTVADAEVVAEAVPEAVAVAIQSGWPTPIGEVSFRDRNVINVLVFGITAPYQLVQDYTYLAGSPLTEQDVSRRRPVVALGHEIAEKLFDNPLTAVGRRVRLDGREVTVKGVIAPKGRLLGQSFDAFVLLPVRMLGMDPVPAPTVRVPGPETRTRAPTRAPVQAPPAHPATPARRRAARATVREGRTRRAAQAVAAMSTSTTR